MHSKILFFKSAALCWSILFFCDSLIIQTVFLTITIMKIEILAKTMRGVSLLAVSLLALTWGQEEVNFGGEVNSDSPASDPISVDPSTFNSSNPEVRKE
jgi:hypothetical protein